MEVLKSINDEIVLKLNSLIKKNYSIAQYNSLIQSKFISIYKVENKSEVAKLYKKLLNRDIILQNLDDNLEKNIEDYLIDLGKEYLNNIYYEDNIVLKVFTNKIFDPDIEIENTTDYPDSLSSYYIDNHKIGEDCTSYHRESRCFMLSDTSKSIYDELNTLSFVLNLDENRLKAEKKCDYYLINLDNNPIGVWSQKLLDDFYEESEDIRLAENHSEDWCSDCTEGNYCKYSDPNNNLEKELISDKLNIPIFSIDLLLKKLGKKISVLDF